MKFAKSRRFSSLLAHCRFSRNASQSGVVNVDLAGCPSLCGGGCDELRAADSGSRTGCASLSDSLGMITVAEDADGDSARDAACVLREMLVMPVGSFVSSKSDSSSSTFGGFLRPEFNPDSSTASSRALKVLSPICMLFVFGFGLRKGGVAASGGGGTMKTVLMALLAVVASAGGLHAKAMLCL